MFIRKEWIQACQFNGASNQQVLNHLFDGVKAQDQLFKTGKGPHPVVLLDLDSTLYEVGPRTHVILRKWAVSEDAKQFPKIRPLFENISTANVGYSIRDTFNSLKLDVTDPLIHPAFEHVKNFWSDRFFSNNYLVHDRAYTGAVDFAKKIYELGAEIIYLTGRDEPRMGPGSRAKLIQDGFPFEKPRTELVLKAAAHLDDRWHKEEAGRKIRQHGRLIASFENEPANVCALAEIFPDAMNVFIDTVCSDHPAPARHDLFRVTGFVD